MNGSEIRQWAWKALKEKRWPLLKAIIIFQIPVPVVNLIIWSLQERAILTSLWLDLLVQMISYIFSLCILSVALDLVRGEKSPSMWKPLRQGQWAKTVTMAFILFLTSRSSNVVKLLFNRLDMRGLGNVIGSILGVVILSLTFFFGYLLFFEPEKSLGEVIREGFDLGMQRFWPVIGFSLILTLQRGGISLIGRLFSVTFPPAQVVVVIFLYGWFFPYAQLAQALLALKYLAPEEVPALEEPVRPVMAQITEGLMGTPSAVVPQHRSMKLIRQGPWYFVANEKGPMVPGPLEKK